jgi:hypothetical protein
MEDPDFVKEIDNRSPNSAAQTGGASPRSRNAATLNDQRNMTVLTDGFSWNGKTYPSLTKAAFAITGTRWNGPKFFGLRAKRSKVTSS